jgi:hypothetical protein
VVGPILFAVELIAIFNVLSGGVALLVSYYAYRFNRLLGSSILRSISIGFALLGFAFLAESATSAALGLSPVELANAKNIQGLEILLYVLLQPVAYAFIAAGYTNAISRNTARKTEAIPVLAIVIHPTLVVILLFLLYLLSQAATVLLLSFIVVAGLITYARNRNPSSLIVMLGFFLVLIARSAILGAVISPSVQLYVGGTIVQFAGFVSLLLFLVRSGRVGPT